MTDFENMTREEFMRPAALGGMSMGEGRKRDPSFWTDPETGEVHQNGGTVFNDCPESPDGYHHFTCYACLNSVEFFRCDYCPKEYSD